MVTTTSKVLRKSPSMFVRMRKPKPSLVFDTYWRFAAERQNVFMRRVKGKRMPWTEDPIISAHKFTNAYRASDRVSQYLIKEVIYGKRYGLEDTVFRIILFKIFNKIETWEFLSNELDKQISLDAFESKRFGKMLDAAKAHKGAIYSAAYIMPSGKTQGSGKSSKHQFHLELLESLKWSGFFSEIASVNSMEEGYNMLLSLPSIGAFLAYQYITDLNYSDHFDFSETEFVMPGPGARDGIRKCFSDFGDYSEADIIKMVCEQQEEHFDRLGLSFQSLWGRPLKLIDCQNLFCEVDKYSRVAHPEFAGRSGRTRIKQKYAPSSRESISPWFPPKWGLNESIRAEALPDVSEKTQAFSFSEGSSLPLFA